VQILSTFGFVGAIPRIAGSLRIPDTHLRICILIMAGMRSLKTIYLQHLKRVLGGRHSQ
jgi:hypothetical protein